MFCVNPTAVTTTWKHVRRLFREVQDLLFWKENSLATVRHWKPPPLLGPPKFRSGERLWSLGEQEEVRDGWQVERGVKKKEAVFEYYIFVFYHIKTDASVTCEIWGLLAALMADCQSRFSAEQRKCSGAAWSRQSAISVKKWKMSRGWTVGADLRTGPDLCCRH